jgi:type I restriction enzyme M protein
LDTQTQREAKNAFIFGDKKNSENLFIERYYQLLKEGGRLGVVLPESIFDTTENKYIRLFLFKYFDVKAIVSLPQVTFEPFTSTKTSLLFAQKKTKKQIEKWNELWDKYGKEWAKLKTRVVRYYDYFVNEAKLSKKYAWVKELTTDLNKLLEKEDTEAVEVINKEDLEHIKINIKRFLKDYITPEDKDLNPKELLTKYNEEIDSLSKLEKETNVFGFYNAWWVFGEVAKEMDYDIFMAEAENVGYKRRSNNRVTIMPNELFDIEFAPNTLNTKEIVDNYDKGIKILKEQLDELKKDLEATQKKIEGKETEALNKKAEKISLDIESQTSEIEQLEAEKTQVIGIFKKYYDGDSLKEKYAERTDSELISHFKSGVLARYKSDDIVLRNTELLTILDHIRKEVIWK